jgi:hypothetical protein
MNGCPRNSHCQSNRYLPRFLGTKNNVNYPKPASDKDPFATLATDGYMAVEQ